MDKILGLDLGHDATNQDPFKTAPFESQFRVKSIIRSDTIEEIKIRLTQDTSHDSSKRVLDDLST